MITKYNGNVLSRIILDIYPDIPTFTSGRTYESISLPNQYEKPSIDEINNRVKQYNNIVFYEKIRKIRNKKLFDTDYRFISDFKFKNDDDKQAWLTYREQLRDFPSTLTPNLEEDDEGNLIDVMWPTPPN
jgi:hypothetical protein